MEKSHMGLHGTHHISTSGRPLLPSPGIWGLCQVAGAAPCVSGWEKRCILEFGWVSCVRGWYVYVYIYIYTNIHLGYVYVHACIHVCRHMYVCLCDVSTRENESQQLVVTLMTPWWRMEAMVDLLFSDAYLQVYSMDDPNVSRVPRTYWGRRADAACSVPAAPSCTAVFSSSGSMFLVWQHMYTKP